MKGYKVKTGIVVLLDFLGIQNLCKKDDELYYIIKWLQCRNEIVDDALIKLSSREKDNKKKAIEYYNNKYHAEIDCFDNLPANFKKKILPLCTTPRLRTFQDTLVLTHDSEYILDYPSIFYFTTEILYPIFIAFLKKGYLIRGAVSVGKFIDDIETNTVVGTALLDAYNWYEKAQWAGIIATPDTSGLIEKFIKNGDTLDFAEHTMSFVKYPVRLKENEENLYVLSWPYKIAVELMGEKKLTKKISGTNSFVTCQNISRNFKKKARKTVLDLIEKIDRPRNREDIELKYRNTKEFVHWYFDQESRLPSKTAPLNQDDLLKQFKELAAGQHERHTMKSKGKK